MKPIVAHQNSNLQRALLEVSVQEYHALPKESALQWDPSPRFEKRMLHLIRAQQTDYWNCINTAGKKAAAIGIAAAVLIGASMSVEAVRNPILNFIATFYEDHVAFEFGIDEEALKNAPKTVETIRLPQTLPDGYTMAEQNDLEILITTIWQDGKGNQITLDQGIMNSTAGMDNEHGTIEKVHVHSWTGYMRTAADGITLMWADDSYTYTLLIPQTLDQQTALALAQQISPQK